MGECDGDSSKLLCFKELRKKKKKKTWNTALKVFV